jgi:hypothetical protein
MANIVTLAELKARVRSQADAPTSNFLTETELLEFINSAYRELWDLLIEADEDRYIQQYAYTTSGSLSDSYRLQEIDDFYRLRGVDIGPAGSRYSLLPYSFQERNDPQMGSIPRYQLRGSDIYLNPAPGVGETLTVYYVPSCTPLEDDDDVVDGINGWEEYIVVDAVIRYLMKEESDFSGFAMRKKGLLDRIESMAVSRDVDVPRATVCRMNDARYSNVYWRQ